MEASGILTREQIESKPRFTVKEVPIPEWGDSVYVRSFTGMDRQELNKWAKAHEAKGDLADPIIVARCLCDASGTRLYGDNETDKVLALDGKILSFIAQAAAEHNGIGEDAIKDAEKN